MKQKNNKFKSFTQIIKFVSGIISWVALVILIIIAGFLLYYFVAIRLYASKGESYKPAFSLYTILSPSMVPNINVYDVIVDLDVKSPEEIHEGDVITFTSTAVLTKGMTITHRVVKVIQDENGYSYETKGDANLSPDGAPALYSNVLGKVAFRFPQLGRLQELLSTKGGWLIVVVIPAICVILSDILKIYRLSEAKNKITNYNQNEVAKNAKEEKHKEIIKKNLERHFTVKRQAHEPDPLPYKVYEQLGLVNKTLPKEIELPKIKNEKTMRKRRRRKR